MVKPTILMVANTGAKTAQYVHALEKQCHVIIARSGKQALVRAGKNPPTIVVLDAVSMRTTGERIAQQLSSAIARPMIHIHPGPRSEANSPAEMILFAPLSIKRLLNCIDLILGEKRDEVLECGPFILNIPNRILIANSREQQLTPKVALLLEIFMRHPNETLPRKTLMEQVWDTDYLGDTRTLDVHIRWVREALDDKSRKPHYLKTVRGVGYKLEISKPEK